MTLLPKVKLKAQVNFPATVRDGTGIDVVKANGSYQFDLDFSDFAPPVGSVSDAVHQNALLWNSVTGSYTLAPMALLSGGSLPDAPNDGQQYGRQSLGWTAISSGGGAPLMNGVAAAGVAASYSRSDHVHPTDTSRAPVASPVFTGSITAIAKGHQLGTAGGPNAPLAPALTDANVLLYNITSGNWAGIGADTNGAIWFRTGLSGTPAPAFYISNSQIANFTNSPLAPTPTAGDNSTKLATTAFVLTNGGPTYIEASTYNLLPGNTGAQNVTAWAALMAFAASNPCTIHIKRGTYDFNASITFNASNVRLTGDGIDATILRCTFASGDFITQSGTIWYQTIDNLTLTSSVTRTSGAMFATGFWKRGLLYRVKISQHFTGISMPQFEICTIAECMIVTPTGAHVAILIGTAAATNQGAGLNILDCFLRGNDETNPASTAVGNTGLYILDVEAVLVINTDLSAFALNAMVLVPQTRVANCYFLQTFFDATVAGHNVYIGGTGVKISLQFTGSWFSAAGGFGAGATNCDGMLLDTGGGFDDIIISGCRFLTPSAVGLHIVNAYMAVNVTGCNFINCGANTGSGGRHSITLSPSSAALRTANITGNYFTGAGGVDLVLTANAANRVNFSGNALTRGIVIPDGTLLGNASGNTDTSVNPATFTVASASTIAPSPCYNYIVIAGTTNINRIQPTYPGHILSLRFIAVLTVADDASNIRLVGNLVTTNTTVLTIVCEGNGDWREISRVVS
jgi:hypothetical protein